MVADSPAGLAGGVALAVGWHEAERFELAGDPLMQPPMVGMGLGRAAALPEVADAGSPSIMSGAFRYQSVIPAELANTLKKRHDRNPGERCRSRPSKIRQDALTRLHPTDFRGPRPAFEITYYS